MNIRIRKLAATLFLLGLILLLVGCLVSEDGEGGFQYEPTSTPTVETTETPTPAATEVPTQTPYPTYTPYPTPIPSYKLVTPEPIDVTIDVVDVTIIIENPLQPNASWQSVILDLKLTNNGTRPVETDVLLRSVGTNRLWRRDPTVNDVQAELILGTRIEAGEQILGEAGYRIWPSVLDSGLEVVVYEIIESNAFPLPE